MRAGGVAHQRLPLGDTMPFPSYLCNFFTPNHHNAYRRVLADEHVDFQTDKPDHQVAIIAADLFLPRRNASGIRADVDLAPRVVLHFPDDAAAEAKLESALSSIARRSPSSSYGLEQGRAVMTAIADAIFPALRTGNVGRTQMARAAAMEIATAIASPRNLTIGMRAVCKAVNDDANTVGCRLGGPSSRGIDIRAGKGRVTLCESNDWSKYHLLGIEADGKQAVKKAGKAAGKDGADPDSLDTAPRNVRWQDGKILIADVCTTFTVKTGEWWLTRKLLPRRTQRATVGARIEMLHVQSPDKRLHKALAFEDGNARHWLANCLARVCRFLRGVGIANASKEQFAEDLLRKRAGRSQPTLTFADADLDEHAMDVHARKVHECDVTESLRHAELIDDDARRVGRRTGTWGSRARYHGKVDLELTFAGDKPAAPEYQAVSLVQEKGKENGKENGKEQAKPARAAAYEAFDTNRPRAPLDAPSGSKGASQPSKDSVPAT
ncbi:hypothetical protein CURE108131_10750 [Cupriavidus respiraculi]|uniref:Uncharacterized protein n=2 Tax=Cupriavidus respiraculi TaxID=195930 RepID=A0ABM8WQ65_9BURK|nr:hypothetical protein LMG21510_01499 [Cupriavidus respiraculi]